MRISIIGAGNIGGNLARLLVKAGHDVALANSRTSSSLQHFADELGDKLHPVNIEKALTYSDLIIFSIPWRNIETLPVFNVPEKIIVDTSNPYKEDGSVYDLGNDISSSSVVKHFPGTKVVKAFNTIWFKHLADTGDINKPMEERRVIPVAGDDMNAKQQVMQLIEEIGFGPLDTGSLWDGSQVQGVQGILYNREVTVKEAISLVDNFKKHLV